MKEGEKYTMSSACIRVEKDKTGFVFARGLRGRLRGNLREEVKEKDDDDEEVNVESVVAAGFTD